MSAPALALNIREFMNRHLVEVFDTMLTMKAVSVEQSDPPHYPERITGSVGFAGETINGAVYLHLSSTFATNVAAAMLGLKPEEVTNENDVNDVIGEVTNMLTGGLKSWLCDNGAACAVSTPAIIRGTSFVVEPTPGVERIWLQFDCDSNRVFVEVHIKSN
jgi:chemotaxis protein CheX